MEAHVAALEAECTRLADARDWLESEKIIMEQDLMAEIHRLEQEARNYPALSIGLVRWI